MALEVLADLPGAVAREAEDALASTGMADLTFPAPRLTLAYAVLCHDMAKPVTMAGPDGAWTYYGHDRVGARLAVEVARREGLEEAARDLGDALDLERVEWLIRDHLFWLHAGEQVGDHAVLKRFGPVAGGGNAPGEDLRSLSWCDGLGSRGPDGRTHPEFLVAAEVRIAQARRRLEERTSRALAEAPVLDGRAVMGALGIDPGPRVGAVQRWVARRTTDPEAAELLIRRNAEFLRTHDVESLRTTELSRGVEVIAGDAAEGSVVGAACDLSDVPSPDGRPCEDHPATRLSL
jgi:hypothetical protein